jgi:hypothetical protein
MSTPADKSTGRKGGYLWKLNSKEVERFNGDFGSKKRWNRRWFSVGPAADADAEFARERARADGDVAPHCDFKYHMSQEECEQKLVKYSISCDNIIEVCHGWSHLSSKLFFVKVNNGGMARRFVLRADNDADVGVSKNRCLLLLLSLLSLLLLLLLLLLLSLFFSRRRVHFFISQFSSTSLRCRH